LYSPSNVLSWDIAWASDGLPIWISEATASSNFDFPALGFNGMLLGVATDSNFTGCAEAGKCYFTGFWSTDPNLAIVPEPWSLTLLAGSVIGLGFYGLARNAIWQA
jgi:hypothetical protein